MRDEMWWMRDEMSWMIAELLNVRVFDTRRNDVGWVGFWEK